MSTEFSFYVETFLCEADNDAFIPRGSFVIDISHLFDPDYIPF